MLSLKKVSLQKLNNSFFLYIPKNWAMQMGLKKSDTMVWYLNESDHQVLHLKKEEESD